MRADRLIPVDVLAAGSGTQNRRAVLFEESLKSALVLLKTAEELKDSDLSESVTFASEVLLDTKVEFTASTVLSMTVEFPMLPLSVAFSL
jgi:hypothetical protein